MPFSAGAMARTLLTLILFVDAKDRYATAAHSAEYHPPMLFRLGSGASGSIHGTDSNYDVIDPNTDIKYDVTDVNQLEDNRLKTGSDPYESHVKDKLSLIHI